MNEISQERQEKMSIRWAIVVATIVAITYGIWYAICGYLPTVASSITWLNGDDALIGILLLNGQPSVAIDTSFLYSRWWDIPIAACWAFIIVSVICALTRVGTFDRPDAVKFLVIGLVSGAIAGLTAYASCIASGLCCLIMYLIVTAVFRLEAKRESIFGDVGLSIGAGLTLGLFYGLGPGFMVAMAIYLVLFLLCVAICGLIALPRATMRIFRFIEYWVNAREVG